MTIPNKEIIEECKKCIDKCIDEVKKVTGLHLEFFENDYVAMLSICSNCNNLNSDISVVFDDFKNKEIAYRTLLSKVRCLLAGVRLNEIRDKSESERKLRFLLADVAITSEDYFEYMRLVDDIKAGR